MLAESTFLGLDFIRIWERKMENVKRKKIKERVIRSTGEKIMHAIVFTFFAVYAFTLLYPFVFLLLNSFKDYSQMLGDPLALPKWLNADGKMVFFQNLFNTYGEAFKMEVNGTNIVGMLVNTITLSIGQTFVSMALTCMAAYTLAKYRFKGNTLIYTTILICSVVPTFGAEPSMYNLMSNILHLRNTYLGMLLMCGGFGAQFLYLHSFFKGIPWSFAESAMIDGASDFRIFLQIMIPLAKNGIIVFTIMKFVGYWNEYWSAFLYYESYPTLAVGLSMLEKDPDYTANVFFAGTVLAIIPMLVFYGIFSDKLMNNLNAGGIKGE